MAENETGNQNEESKAEEVKPEAVKTPARAKQAKAAEGKKAAAKKAAAKKAAAKRAAAKKAAAKKAAENAPVEPAVASTKPTAKAAAHKVMLEAEAIVTGVLDKAKEGNTQAAKFLFEFAGIKMGRGDAGEAQAVRDSLIARIASRLRIGDVVPEVLVSEDEE